LVSGDSDACLRIKLNKGESRKLQETLRPNAAGQYAEWSTAYPSGTAHWDCCNDNPPDDDSSYVETNVGSWRREVYNLQDHGGSGIKKAYLLEGFKHGIAKINIGTTIRQAYEQGVKESTEKGFERTYQAMVEVITQELEVKGSVTIINP
jgi:fructose/tagatose bisphosphate aldolase